MRYCSCENCFADGGFDYLRFGGNDLPETVEVEVEATKEQLYNDWNQKKDKFGIIQCH